MQDQDFNVEFEELQIVDEGISDFNELANRPKYNGAEMTGATNIPKVPTKTSDLANDSGFQNSSQVGSAVAAAINAEQTLRENADNALGLRITNEAASLQEGINTVANAVSTETSNREAADSNLQSQIDSITSQSDVVDVVGTYAELMAYDTQHLGDNDIVKVLTDSTKSNAISYYRWNKTAETWTYIGSQGPFYTKGEADNVFVPKTRTVNGKALSSDVILSAADVGAVATEAGKGLSTNDFTTAEKEKLSGIEDGAQVNYPLYLGLGPNEDGAVAQSVVTEALGGKQDTFKYFVEDTENLSAQQVVANDVDDVNNTNIVETFSNGDNGYVSVSSSTSDGSDSHNAIISVASSLDGSTAQIVGESVSIEGEFTVNGDRLVTENGFDARVPAPTAADADKFLKGDGTWADAGGGGGGTDVYSHKPTAAATTAIYIPSKDSSGQFITDFTPTNATGTSVYIAPNSDSVYNSGSVVIKGRTLRSDGTSNTVINGSTGQYGSNCTAISGTANNSYSVAVGTGGTSTSTLDVENRGTAVGHGARAKSGTSSGIGDATSLGKDARSASGGTAVGGSAEAGYQNSGQIAASRYDTALGYNSKSFTKYSVALGSYSDTSAQGEVSVGGSRLGTNGYNGTGYRKITNVYDGENANDAMTVGQANALIDAINSALSTSIPHIGNGA